MRRLITVPTVLLALTAAGCGSGTDRGEAPASAAASDPGTGGAPEPEGSPTVPGQPVGCGNIADALGRAHGVALFADPGAAGTVGCTEARTVMKEFFRRDPPRSGGHHGPLAVSGWSCRYDGGPTGTWITACRKGERAMHTEEAAEDSPGGPPDGSEQPGPEDPSLPMDEPSTTEL
ncbi:hypothetical protein MUU72_17135 [Streptomyces sp. RS10V-4]|uniref:hypothetical protein n=1 Tax=Streptomyces rhizoryzae TaxID=2932493 RepID=UPI002006AC19|nr:hypothetical protein [Streptomyces rhizoryzae]MCK7624807.1 hypothetical protein [Streptomyces rhizoryzae]